LGLGTFLLYLENFIFVKGRMMKKTIVLLAVAGLVLALAPAAQAAPITITSAIVSSNHGRGVYNDPIAGSNAALFNGVGLTGTAGNQVHDGENANHWLSAQNGQSVEDVTVLFDLGSIQDVASMKIWNFYEPYAPSINRGVKDLEITYGTTLTAGVIDSPTTVTSVTQFDQAIIDSGAIAGVTYDFDDGNNGTNHARYILFSIATSYGTEGGYVDGDFVGLDEVQFSTAPEPTSPLAITSITSLGSGNWELKLKGEPSTAYEFRSSTTLDFDTSTLVPITTVILGSGGGTDVTTTSSGDATVEMSLGDLGAVPANFVRAEGGS
jgi:hypothetical protein